LERETFYQPIFLAFCRGRCCST